VTDAERLHVATLLAVVKGGEWVRGRCPRCSYQQLRGHKCSCPVKLALKRLKQAIGQDDDLGLDDDDLIVERALRDLATVDESGRRAVVRQAVDMAVALGGRA
jgi:hypothetical protein